MGLYGTENGAEMWNGPVKLHIRNLFKDLGKVSLSILPEETVQNHPQNNGQIDLHSDRWLVTCISYVHYTYYTHLKVVNPKIQAGSCLPEDNSIEFTFSRWLAVRFGTLWAVFWQRFGIRTGGGFQNTTGGSFWVIKGGKKGGNVGGKRKHHVDDLRDF